MNEILKAYSEWLENKGYIDSDWWSEEPNTVELFLAEHKKDECEWIMGKYWYTTSCGNKHQSPATKFRYCPFCAKSFKDGGKSKLF